VKTFIHTFRNGTVIKLTFDLSKPMPFCESNLKLDKQPIEILQEYRTWQDAVILPFLMRELTIEQLENFARYGLSKMNQMPK